MSKLQEIKAAQLDARKRRLEFGMDIRASLLTTFIGEAEVIGKNACRDVTDSEVITLLKKFEKGIVETLEHLIKRGDSVSIIAVEQELAIVQEFLPSRISDDIVKQDIIDLNVPAEKKSMSVITKALRAKYGEQFDGQQVSKVFETLLRK